MERITFFSIASTVSNALFVNEFLTTLIEDFDSIFEITFDMYDAFNFTESIPPRYLEFELELKIKNLNFSVKIFDIYSE